MPGSIARAGHGNFAQLVLAEFGALHSMRAAPHGSGSGLWNGRPRGAASGGPQRTLLRLTLHADRLQTEAQPEEIASISALKQ
jgi:hypothetical protein